MTVGMMQPSAARQAACLICAIVLAALAVSCGQAPHQSRPSASEGVQRSARDALQWNFHYDAEGRLDRVTDPGGHQTTTKYLVDDAGRTRKVVERLDDGREVTREFDQLGRLTVMLDAGGSVEYGHDDLGRLNQVAREGAPAITYSHARDSDQITRIEIGDFYTIDLRYDFLGRKMHMDTPAGEISTEYQRGRGEVIRSLPNGVQTVWKRSPNGALQHVTHRRLDGPAAGTYTILSSYQYHRGSDGRISDERAVSSRGQEQRRYDYDPMGRLLAAHGPADRSLRYVYDATGNRTNTAVTGEPAVASTYDWAGRLTSLGGTAVEHDDSGNLAALQLDDVARRYRYHPDGRLAEVRVGDETVTYAYDGNGHLISRTTSAGTTRFIPDPTAAYWQPLVIDGPDGSRTLVVWDGATPLALVRGGQTTWLLHDRMGSVRLLVDHSGTVAQYRDYDPFGVPDQALPSQELSPAYAALFWDDLAGVYLTPARAYQPSIGAFLQPDPQLRLPRAKRSSHSLYAYAGGDPINSVDRNGADAEDADIEKLENRIEALVREHSTGYTRCGQWQGLVYGELAKDEEFLKKFKVTYAGVKGDWIPPVEAIALGRPGLTVLSPIELEIEGIEYFWHFYVVVQSRTSGKMYAVDPWARTMNPFRFENVKEFVPVPGKDILHEWGDTTLDEGSRSGVPATWLDLPAAQPPVVTPTPTQPAGVSTPTKIDTHRLEQSRSMADAMMVQMAAARTFIDRYDIASGPGQVAGPGGFASEGAYAAMQDFRDRQHAAASPVGGVYLGGAGQALEGLGLLRGVYTDDNGNFVLIGERGQDIHLPPLRMDDLVTVFRSVYLHGEGPTVTIDPNPEDPSKSAMVIVHSDATVDTYVGWVLYQADRLMKSYGQGVDNKTTKDVNSRVPGYDDVLETIYFGSGDPRASQRSGNWERFWIVPAAARRYEGAQRDLTLLDVPLKLKTQRMKWVGDQLVDDDAGASSPGSLAFSRWFTDNYDAIAKEQLLLPPAESGIAEPVAVFKELKRIALMTAVAETLRDQGVAMPFWMRDYPVRHVPFERFTPGLEVTRRRRVGNVLRTARIFGGVELSADHKAVKTYRKLGDAAKVAPKLRGQVKRNVSLAKDLEHAVTMHPPPVTQAPVRLHPVKGVHGDFQTASLPGAQVRALNPGRLDETDLIVPLGDGRELRLERHFNSFFDPSGSWGRGWTMNLPRLQEIRVPRRKPTAERALSRAYELLTPLNSIYARFNDVRPVEALGGQEMQVPDTQGPFLGLAAAKPKFLQDVTTLVVFLHNGQRWHFTEAGDFVALEDGPRLTVYERGKHVKRIVALVGGSLIGQISLEYSSDGKVTKAVGRTFAAGEQSATVSYHYSSAGRLLAVSSDAGTLHYHYDGTRVDAASWAGKEPSARPRRVRVFEYGKRGQVVAQDSATGRVEYAVTATGDGLELTGKMPGQPVGLATRFDARMRPVSASAPDGSRTVWHYTPDGSVKTTVMAPDGSETAILEASNGQQRTISSRAGPPLVLNLDAAGRVVTAQEGRQVVMSQTWRADGQLAMRTTQSRGLSMRYDGRGLLSSVVVVPPSAGRKPNRWQEIEVDWRGAPVKITDHTGLSIQMTYDRKGNIEAVYQQAPEGNIGYTVERDDGGRVRAHRSSWGDTHYAYSEGGTLEHVESRRGGQKAVMALSNGRVDEITNFRGGVTNFQYYVDGVAVGSLRHVTAANGLELSYGYDGSRRPTTVSVGADRCVELAYDKRGRLASYRWARSCASAPTRH